MKPLVEDTWIIAAPEAGCYLCRSSGGLYSSKEFAKAARFTTAEDAEAVQAKFAEQQRNTPHGPREWRVYRAQTRTAFKAA